jgi:hypothetical protein
VTSVIECTASTALNSAPKHAALFGCRQDPHAQRLRQIKFVTGLRKIVGTNPRSFNRARHSQPEDRLRRVDAMTSGQWNPGARARVSGALKDVTRHGRIESGDRPAENCDREERFSTHRIDIADRIHCGDRAEVEGVVHDRHEKIRRADQRILLIEGIDRRVVACVVSDEQPGVRRLAWNSLKNFRKHARRDLAAAPCAVGILRQANGPGFHAAIILSLAIVVAHPPLGLY